MTSEYVDHVNLEAVPVAASGSTRTLLRFSPLSPHSADIAPILRPLYYTIARHVVTLSEPRGTSGFVCLFVIFVAFPPSLFIRSNASFCFVWRFEEILFCM